MSNPTLCVCRAAILNVLPAGWAPNEVRLPLEIVACEEIARRVLGTPFADVPWVREVALVSLWGLPSAVAVRARRRVRTATVQQGGTGSMPDVSAPAPEPVTAMLAFAAIRVRS